MFNFQLIPLAVLHAYPPSKKKKKRKQAKMVGPEPRP